MEYYTAKKMNVLQLCVTIWINLINIMLGERNQIPKNILYECIYINANKQIRNACLIVKTIQKNKKMNIIKLRTVVTFPR